MCIRDRWPRWGQEFVQWKNTIKTTLAHTSKYHEEAIVWLKQAEEHESYEDIPRLRKWIQLDTMLYTALDRVIKPLKVLMPDCVFMFKIFKKLCLTKERS